MSKGFFDTNILVYHVDKQDMKKHTVSIELFKESVGQGQAVISTQVIQEFYVVATAKLHVNPLLVKQVIHTFENMEVVTIGRDHINEAIDTSVQNKISFWDALVVVAAESAKCELLYSEDLNPGQIIRNVKMVNPFKM